MCCSDSWLRASSGCTSNLTPLPTISVMARSDRSSTLPCWGIPIPLCSCGVVPAVAGLKKQGANNGACLAFLISAPETGADSIALTYSLMDPIMTVMRPIAALVTASCAGLLENFTGRSYGETSEILPDRDVSCGRLL